MAAVTRRCELDAGSRRGSASSAFAGSCRESLGSSADLEGLFFLLLIICLLCPPTGVPQLNGCPDSKTLISQQTLS